MIDYAFPQGSTNNGGMTLRDYFAAQALIGLITANESLSDIDPFVMAVRAYKAADAMMKERSKCSP